jgi:hypothetical protein
MLFSLSRRSMKRKEGVSRIGIRVGVDTRGVYERL